MSGDIDPSNKVDTLLGHQSQRFESIANNAVDFIKINLLILGAFAPFIASVLGDDIDPSKILLSDYVLGGTLAWVSSTFLATAVYRSARGRSVSQFDVLEQAIANNWRITDLEAEIIDNNDEYEGNVSVLMTLMAVSIGLSLVAVLSLALAVADSVFTLSSGFKSKSMLVVVVFGFVTGFGIEIWNMGGVAKNHAGSWAWRQLDKIPGRAKIFTRNQETSLSSIDKEDVLQDYVSSATDLSQVRARLLQIIQETAGVEPWTFDELLESVRDEYPDLGLTREMVERLVSAGYIRKIESPGPATYVIHEREDEIVNGKHIDKVVGEELGRLIGHTKNDDTVKTRISTSQSQLVERSAC